MKLSPGQTCLWLGTWMQIYHEIRLSLLVSQKRPSLRFRVVLYRWVGLQRAGHPLSLFHFQRSMDCNFRIWEEGNQACVSNVCYFFFLQDFNNDQGWGSWAQKYITISFLEVVYVWENIFLGEMFVYEGDVLLRMLWILRNIKPWLLMACKDTYCLMLLRAQKQNRLQTWVLPCLLPSRVVSYGCSNRIHATCSLIQSSRKREEFLS